METETERLVQSNEGSGSTAAETETGDLGQVRETVSSDKPLVEQSGDVQSGETEQSTQPPAGYEGVPRELWPNKDGNPPTVTPRLLRKLRAQYFTVRHPRLEECGHLLDMINQPKNNCENCWFQFFNTHPQLVEIADQFFRTHGKGAMEGLRGKKFVKNFCRYMATVIHMMKEEGRIDESGNLKGTDASSINSSAILGDGTVCEEAVRTQEFGRPGNIDQRGEAESRGIGSGIHQ